MQRLTVRTAARLAALRYDWHRVVRLMRGAHLRSRIRRCFRVSLTGITCVATKDDWHCMADVLGWLHVPRNANERARFANAGSAVHLPG
jgi:hypothetical protein